VDDRRPVERLIKGLFGKLFADKGYISKDLFERLFFNDEQQLQLITKLKKGMKNRLMHSLTRSC